MEKNGIEALLVLQKMDFFYLSGTTQDGVLFVPLAGKPLLVIKREFERARIESPLEDVVPFKSNRELPSLIRNHLGKLPETLGLELDVLPVRDYFRYQELFQGIQLRRCLFHPPGDTRKIKSPFEIRSHEGGGRNRKKGLPTREKDP